MGCCIGEKLMSFKFDFKKEHLAKIIPGNPYIDYWFNALEMILPDYDIDTIPRVAAFLAQTAHESGNYRFLKENLNYRATSLRKVFPKYFPTDALAAKYAHNQAAIANRVYGNRMGNGPESSGDGFRYCGRGLIQLTGKSNYIKFAESIETPVEEIPEYLSTFEGAIQSACWYWEENNLNRWADQGDILTLTKRINGGTIGLSDRKDHYNHAMKVLSS
jgi:putative chitinase